MRRPIAALAALSLLGAAPPPSAAALDPLLQWTAVTESVAPTSGSTMAIDGPGRVAYLFGGYRPGVGLSADVVRTDLTNPDLAWTLVRSGVGRPSARTNAHTHFDVGSGRLLVLGGTPATTPHDAWTWEPATGTWTAFQTATPGPDIIRRAFPLVHDLRRDRLLYFDDAGAGLPAPVWALDLAAPTPDWTMLATSVAPWIGGGAAAAYDSLGDRVFVIGSARHLWALDLATGTWSTAITASSCPFTVGTDLQLAWDAPTNTLIARRFVSDYATTAKAIVDLSSPPVWVTRWDEGGPEVGWRPWAHDRVARRLVVHQEVGNIPLLYEMSASPALDWTARVPSDRPTSMGYTDAADFQARWWYLLDTAGGLRRAHLDDLGRFETVTASGTPPLPRRAMSAAWDSTETRMLFSGGVDVATDTFQGDVYSLELGPTPHWARVPTLTPGPPHALCGAFDVAKRYFYVTAINGFRRDLWRLDLSQSPAVWTSLLPLLPIEPQVIAVDRGGDRLLAAGGRYGFVVDLRTNPPVAGPLVERPVGVGWPNSPAIAFDPRRSRLDVHRGWTRFSNTGVVKSDETDAFGGPGTTAMYVNAGVTNEQITPETGSEAVFDPRRDRMILLNGWRAGYDPSGYPELYLHLGLWTLQFDPAVPARLDLVEAVGEAGGIRVRFAGEGWSGDVGVERTEAAIDAWDRIGTAVEITPGTVEFVDLAAVPGVAYRYRGRFFDETGERVTAPSAAVTPAAGMPRLALALGGGTIVRGSVIEFTLGFAESGPAVLDVLDVHGRRVARLEVDGVAGERRTVTIAPRSRLRAGLYFARLSQGGEARLVRLVRL